LHKYQARAALISCRSAFLSMQNSCCLKLSSFLGTTRYFVFC